MIMRAAARPALRARLARGLAVGLALGAGLVATPARAHIELLTPSARYTPNLQKDPPCGDPLNPPGAGPVATYQAGETITVEFDEFVDHSGHFRIALDPTGTDSFVLPMGFDDFYNSPEVLLDDIPDGPGGVYSIEVTLPDTPCEACTLQLIQVMNDGAWGPGDSDLYFQCADIVIEPAGAGTGDPTTGADDTGPGGSSDGDPGSSSADGPAGSEGVTADGPGGPGGSEGDGSGTSGPADSEGDDGGCGCRSSGGPAGAAPWLLVALVARRRRRG